MVLPPNIWHYFGKLVPKFHGLCQTFVQNLIASGGFLLRPSCDTPVTLGPLTFHSQDIIEKMNITKYFIFGMSGQQVFFVDCQVFCEALAPLSIYLPSANLGPWEF